MSEPNRTDEIEGLLVMAAAILGLGPETDLTRANTVGVLNQALLWLGLSPEEINQSWWEAEEPESEAHSLNEQVYGVLVRMVHERKSPLFSGQGNWGVPGEPDCPPCWPQFNSCRLTAYGQGVAEKLLAEHPQFLKPA